MGGFIFEENIIEPSYLLGNVIFPFFVKKLACESSVTQITHNLPFTWAWSEITILAIFPLYTHSI